ncbi:hypothetical protein Q8A67_008874 [Cirrhinus molitorella]|uniref:Uncharacterized protein n=1 Tax=Cirrhinus molitorella TaxID=172907 RepID=A0AA88PR57_9TELE|nr:hypothetical protein Q8A67_008874 [Cirrhinus molitorella]
MATADSKVPFVEKDSNQKAVEPMFDYGDQAVCSNQWEHVIQSNDAWERGIEVKVSWPPQHLKCSRCTQRKFVLVLTGLTGSDVAGAALSTDGQQCDSVKRWMSHGTRALHTP